MIIWDHFYSQIRISKRSLDWFLTDDSCHNSKSVICQKPQLLSAGDKSSDFFQPKNSNFERGGLARIITFVITAAWAAVQVNYLPHSCKFDSAAPCIYKSNPYGGSIGKRSFAYIFSKEHSVLHRKIASMQIGDWFEPLKRWSFEYKEASISLMDPYCTHPQSVFGMFTRL